jgi:hypothetical protein
VRAFASRAIFSELPSEATYGTCAGGGAATTSLEHGATTGAAPGRARKSAYSTSIRRHGRMGHGARYTCIMHPASGIRPAEHVAHAVLFAPNRRDHAWPAHSERYPYHYFGFYCLSDFFFKNTLAGWCMNRIEEMLDSQYTVNKATTPHTQHDISPSGKQHTLQNPMINNSSYQTSSQKL